MRKSIMDLKRNDRVQNQFALYYLLENGKINMRDEKFTTRYKKSINKNDDKGSIISNEFAIGAVDIAIEMARFSNKEIFDFIYDDIKDEKQDIVINDEYFVSNNIDNEKEVQRKSKNKNRDEAR